MQEITICMPIYNAEEFLQLSIKSVLQQSHMDFELLLIDDGSTDNSTIIMEKFARIDKRIKIISDGENKGLITRLNDSIEIAKGRYYVRMDADDVMLPNRIEEQFRVMNNNPDIDLVHSGAISINKKNKILGIRNSFHRTASVIHPTVFAKRSFLLKNKYEDGFYQMEDMELWYRTKNQYNFFYINTPLIFYREDSTSISIKQKKMYVGLKKFCLKYNFPFLKKIKILAGNRMKFWIYSICEIIEIDRFLINLRFKKMPSKDVDYFNNILKEIDG